MVIKRSSYRYSSLAQLSIKNPDCTGHFKGDDTIDTKSSSFAIKWNTQIV